MVSEVNIKEALVRDLAPKVYGTGSTVTISRNKSGGIIRVLNPQGFRVAGEGWEPCRTSCNTEEQAWHNVLEYIKDDKNKALTSSNTKPDFTGPSCVYCQGKHLGIDCKFRIDYLQYK